jgi:hypothetical protein
MAAGKGHQQQDRTLANPPKNPIRKWPKVNISNIKDRLPNAHLSLFQGTFILLRWGKMASSRQNKVKTVCSPSPSPPPLQLIQKALFVGHFFSFPFSSSNFQCPSLLIYVFPG